MYGNCSSGAANFGYSGENIVNKYVMLYFPGPAYGGMKDMGYMCFSCWQARGRGCIWWSQIPIYIFLFICGIQTLKLGRDQATHICTIR